MTVTFTGYFCEQTGAITSSSGPFIEQVSPTTVIPKEQSVSSPIPTQLNPFATGGSQAIYYEDPLFT